MESCEKACVKIMHANNMHAVHSTVEQLCYWLTRQIRFFSPMGVNIIWGESGFELRLAKSHRFAHHSLTTMTTHEREIDTQRQRERAGEIKRWSRQCRLTHALQCTCQSTVHHSPIHFDGREKGTVLLCTMPGHSSSAQSSSLGGKIHPKPC